MTVQISNAADHTLIQLTGPLTIAEASETRDQLALAFSTADRIDIDLAGVTDIDTAGIQLLLTLPQENVPVTFRAISGSLHVLLDSLNLLTPLGLEH